MKNVAEFNTVGDIEEYIVKYRTIENLLTVLEDNYLVTPIDKYTKDELAFEMSRAFPLIQATVNIISETLRETNDKFETCFYKLISNNKQNISV